MLLHTRQNQSRGKYWRAFWSASDRFALADSALAWEYATYNEEKGGNITEKLWYNKYFI